MMKKAGIRSLNTFITKDLVTRIIRQYQNFEILSESDLQCAVIFALRNFLKEDVKSGRLTVHTCYSFANPRMHPDVVVLKRTKPWVIIELKEGGVLRKGTAMKERTKMETLKTTLARTRGVTLGKSYLVYVGRRGVHRVLPDKKENRWFREVPITLEKSAHFGKIEIEAFRKRFKILAKFHC